MVRALAVAAGSPLSPCQSVGGKARRLARYRFTPRCDLPHALGISAAHLLRHSLHALGSQEIPVDATQDHTFNGIAPHANRTRDY